MSLIYRAEGAHPVGGQVLELGAGSDAVLRVALRGVILIPADVANILFHIVLVFRIDISGAKIRLFSYMKENICKKERIVLKSALP